MNANYYNIIYIVKNIKAIFHVCLLHIQYFMWNLRHHIFVFDTKQFNNTLNRFKT